MTTDARLAQAGIHYEHSVFGGHTAAIAPALRELDGVEADLALARGRLLHARFLTDRVENLQELELFERAAELYEVLGDTRGKAEAVFWVGAFHHVVRGDAAAAEPVFERALELATEAGDRLTMSYALRHLGIADQQADRFEAARARLEESTRLRRELGFLPGVAANLIGLAYLADQQGRPEDAAPLLAEADELAGSSGADGVLGWVAEARADLSLPS
ncbi:tetratricopeptide repeat protein [Kitasatospora viridis]|uniref:Tetratricopeptide repeat protein n=1 Tax=Kitasatospora viridis TaxID=281105 RepID=A0A561UPX8_9ACTN|nr:tetratricopeptide repeat protein [Kitasatospora viridis]TWG01425.1 tetratricopeptide repeat protein [Kitasatospora viridis]